MSKEMRKQIDRVKNWKQFLKDLFPRKQFSNEEFTDFKIGDKVLVNPEIIKNDMERYEKMMKNALGKHFKREIHMA